jgi:hypothetical protein
VKKLIATGLIMTGLLVGCSDEHSVDEIQPNATNRFNGINDDVSIIIDSKTGCKYIYIDSGQGNYRTTAMSPLMKSNGTADCSK